VERLAELREGQALTLRDLAEKSGVDANTINQVELGHRKPRPSTLRKLAKALDVDVREFFEEPVPLGEAPREAGQEETFEEMMARERRAGLTDAAIITEYERLVREYRISWRDALENLVEPWEERLRSGSAFDRGMVEQFFDDVAAISRGVARALKTGVTESLLENRYRQAPITAEDVEEMHRSGMAHAASRILDVCEKVWDAAVEQFSQDELAEVRRLHDETRRALGRVA